MHTTIKISSLLRWLASAILGVAVTAVVAPAIAHAAFGPPTNYAAGDGPRSVVVADFNGDSLPDLAVANENSDNVSLLLGTAGGAFTAPTNFAAGDGPRSVAVGDFNGDARPDLAIANDISDNVSILLGNGSGGFGAPTNFAVGRPPSFRRDRRLQRRRHADLAIANQSSDNISILLGIGTGSFGAATNFTVGAAPSRSRSADSTATRADLAVSEPRFGQRLNPVGQRHGSFGGATDSPPATTPFGRHRRLQRRRATPTWRPRMPTRSTSRSCWATAAGAFTGPTHFATGSTPRTVAAGDFDGDSRLDLTNCQRAGWTASRILLGNGSGGFTSPTNFVAGDGPYSIAVGFFNGDSRLDLVTANKDSDNVSILLNTTGYVRPKTASPVRVSLVPAHNECTSPNRVHGPPDFPGNGSDPDGSCNPPSPSSAHLTAGNPNANFTGLVKLRTVVGAPGGVDDSDVAIDVNVTDVRCQAGTSTCGSTNAVGGDDYTGEVQLRIELRITHRFNGSTAAGRSGPGHGRQDATR